MLRNKVVEEYIIVTRCSDSSDDEWQLSERIATAHMTTLEEHAAVVEQHHKGHQVIFFPPNDIPDCVKGDVVTKEELSNAHPVQIPDATEPMALFDELSLHVNLAEMVTVGTRDMEGGIVLLLPRSPRLNDDDDDDFHAASRGCKREREDACVDERRGPRIKKEPDGASDGE